MTIPVKIIKKPKKGAAGTAAGGFATIGNGDKVELGDIRNTLSSVQNIIDSLSNVLIPVDSAGVRVDWGSPALWAVKSVKGFYSEEFVSARGLNANGGSGPVGASYLYDLLDAGINNPVSGQALIYDGSKWVNQALQTGLDEQALGDYLSTNNYAKKSDIPSLAGYATETWVQQKGYLTQHQPLTDYLKKTEAASTYVAQVAGKGLSTNDFTNALLTKLNGIEAGANKYVHPAGGADTTITAAPGNVLSAIIVNNLGHVSSVESKTLAAGDIPSLAISKITGLQTALDNKLDKSAFDELFEKVNIGTASAPVYAIKAKFGLYTEQFLSARGQNPNGAGGAGVTLLSALNDVELSNLSGGQALVYNGTKWVNQAIQTGLDEAALGMYLTANNYAKKSDIPSLTGYATQTWVQQQGYLTAHQTIRTLTIQKNGTAVGTFNPTGSANATLNITDVASASTLSSHTGNTTVHITAAERTKWNKVVTDFAAITGTDSDTIINKWEEVVAFLDTYTEADTLAGLLGNKVDKVAGKGLSANDFTDALLTKLNGIEAGANKYIHPTGGANATIAAANGKVLSAITVNNLGHVTAVASKSLVAADIPALAISKITGLQTALDSKLNKSVFEELFEKVNIGTASAPVYAIKAKFGLYTEQFLSARGVNPNGGSGGGSAGSSYNRLDTWAGYTSAMDGYVLSAKLGHELHNRVSTLEGKDYVTLNTTQTITANKIIKTDTQPCLRLDSNTANRDVYMYVYSGGAAKACFGWFSSQGSYVYNTASQKYLGIKDDGTPHFQGNKLWHSGNDGSGSGLDADTVDGVHNGSLTAEQINYKNVGNAVGQVQFMQKNSGWNAWDAPSQDWYSVLKLNHQNGDSYYSRVLAFEFFGHRIYTHAKQGGSDKGWKTIAFTTDNVASATKLATARTIWGQSFDGSGNVDGILTVHHGGTAGIYLNSTTGESSYSCQATGGSRWVMGGYATQFFIRGGSAGNVKLAILNNGDVGIGTTSPQYKLHVAGSIRADSWLRTSGATGWYNDSYGGGWYMQNTSYIENFGSKRIKISGISDYYGIWLNGSGLCCEGYAGTFWNQGHGAVNVGIENNTNQTPLLVAYRKGSATAHTGNDRMFVIELLNTGEQLNISMRSQTVMQLYPNRSVFVPGGIWSDGYVSARGQNTSSDERLKNLLKTITLSTRDIANAPSVLFTWKKDGKVDVGSIAQYWERLLPQLAPTDFSGYKTLQYGKAALLASISNAREILSLEKRVERLEAENKELRKKIELLTA